MGDRFVRGDPLCSLPIRAPPVRSYSHIAEPNARASFFGMTPPRPVKTGQQERQDLHEMRRVVPESLTFVQRLVDEPELACWR